MLNQGKHEIHVIAVVEAIIINVLGSIFESLWKKGKLGLSHHYVPIRIERYLDAIIKNKIAYTSTVLISIQDCYFPSDNPISQSK